MVRNRKGNFSTVVLGLSVFFALLFNTLYIIERTTTNIKRQNLHSVVVSANLAAYNAIDQGDKDTVVSIRPDILQGYIKKPDTILSDYKLNEVVNIMTSEYFPRGQRYKSIFINEEPAYQYFCDYMQLNGGLTPSDTDNHTFLSLNPDTNKADINELTINTFEVYNAVYKDMSKVDVPSTIKSENRQFSGIHIDLTSKVNKAVRLDTIGKETVVPIHIDTDITLYRPTIK